MRRLGRPPESASHGLVRCRLGRRLGPSRGLNNPVSPIVAGAALVFPKRASEHLAECHGLTGLGAAEARDCFEDLPERPVRPLELDAADASA